MENLGDKFEGGPETAFSRVLNRDLFLFLLDLEVKRARRYQNFLCLMFLKIKQCSKNNSVLDFRTCYETLSDLLTVEMRESDILGSITENKLAILLPYTDVKAGNRAKSRFEDTLKYYDFKNRGFEVMIEQICFPVNGTNAMDLIKKVLGGETA
ncbi:MAG: hypothetical protein AB1502_08910 [Thermodesulfobacteriota bacterium]